MKLTLVRHTSLQVEAGICYGQSDLDVSPQFDQELADLRHKLHDTAFDAVYSSPLQRCSKLAHALVQTLPSSSLSSAMAAPMQVQHDARLQELHFGDWEMQAWDAIPRAVFDVWAQNYAELAPPNGETFAALQQRGVDCLQALQAKHTGEHVLVVTHGGMIRALIAHVLNMPLKGLFRFQVDYASLTRLDLQGTVPKIDFVNR